MKKNRNTIIGIVLISAIIISVIVMAINKNNGLDYEKVVYTRPEYEPIATIYHSEMLGEDAGTIYKYDIYKSEKNDKEYFYIKNKSKDTIAGPIESKDIASGSLRNSNDLRKIQKDIEKDYEDNKESYVSYFYINNGANETCENISVLEKKLFK